jgi:hypothetical protein
MKIIAEKFRMAKNLSKRDLATAIAQKLSTMETINQLQVVLATPNATFRRDKNTIPRILNILTKYPDGMLHSRRRATWMDLQNGTTRAGSEVWGSVGVEFNDRTLNSGGLVYLHHLFQSEGINPEEPNPGMITAQHCYNMFWEVQKAYASCYKNFQASGQHHGHDLWLYSKIPHL